MGERRLTGLWTLVIFFLVAVIVIGAVVAWSRYSPGQPVQISMPQVREWDGEIYIGGAVNIPGYYPFHSSDALEALVQAAGGIREGSILDQLELYVPETENTSKAQKIDINRAEVWLLDALPGVGETLAQRVVDYREQHGLFRNTGELLNVEGIGDSTYRQIKDLVTVSD